MGTCSMTRPVFHQIMELNEWWSSLILPHIFWRLADKDIFRFNEPVMFHFITEQSGQSFGLLFVFLEHIRYFHHFHLEIHKWYFTVLQILKQLLSIFVPACWFATSYKVCCLVSNVEKATNRLVAVTQLLGNDWNWYY